MKKLILPIFLMLLNSVFAQQEKYFDEDDTSSYVLIIPFEDKMYLSESDISVDLSKHNKYSSSQLNGSVKFHIMREISASVRKMGDVMTFEDYELKKASDLKALYSSVLYEIEPVKKTIFNFSGRINYNRPLKIDDNKHSKRKEMVMKVKVQKPETFVNVANKYNGKFFVFITQIELKKAPNTSQTDLAEDDFFRQAKIHYNIINNKGKVVKSDVAYAFFPNYEKEIRIITNEYISKAAYDIAYKIPTSLFSK
jgi:hypothetical protein